MLLKAVPDQILFSRTMEIWLSYKMMLTRISRQLRAWGVAYKVEKYGRAVCPQTAVHL